MAHFRPLVLLAAAALGSACSSVHDDLSRQFLRPPSGWLAEPADVGLVAEPFEVRLHSAASLTGFWIPNAQAAGRTVVLLHDEQTNASVMHPYYTFLHDAGFHVLVVDPRGFGHSLGTASMRAWLYDLPALFDWLKQKPDVDPQRIAVFGTGLGSVAAMWAVMARHGTAAVFEHLPSPRDMLRESGADGQPLGAFSLGMLEFSGLPEDIEPDENAAKTLVPALFLTTALEPTRDRLSLLRTFDAYQGDKQLWVIPEAGRAPNAMATHDGEYQRRLGDWLTNALGGPDERIVTDWKRGSSTAQGEAWYDVQLTAVPATHGEPWAVETCAITADGAVHFAHSWLEGERGTVRLRLPQPPRLVSAARVYSVVSDDEQGFQRNRSELSRSAAAVAPLWPRIEALRNGSLSGSDLDALAADLTLAEASEPFHPRLAAELAGVFARIGTAWYASDDPSRREQALHWLERAVAAVPEKPQLHIWPGLSTTYGFSQADEVAAAKQLLQRQRR